ncbi:MAG TPA: HAD-IA family hydrolase [Blastocatellia bacterium]|nr:HAD-IA family hydrolase [Blastocatellia bacterium]
MARIDTLLFDLDGTLIDTVDLIVESYHHVWEKNFGYRQERSVITRTMGMLIDLSMHQLIETGVSENQIKLIEDQHVVVRRLLDQYREFNLAHHDKLIKPFPNVNETLQELRQRGYRIGVVTSKRLLGAERGLKAFDLDKLVDVVIAAEDTTEHKPHPAPLIKGMERLESSPETTAYIGDSTHDMIAGKRAGVFTVAALWGPFDPEELRATLPDLIISLPIELLEQFQFVAPPSTENSG